MMDLTTSSHLALLSGWGSFASLFHVRTVLPEEYKALLIIITFVTELVPCSTQYLSFSVQSLHTELSQMF